MKRIFGVVIIALVLAVGAYWLWTYQNSDELPDAPDTVLIDAQYQHPTLVLDVIPQAAAADLEIAVDPQLDYQLNREEGRIELVLQEGGWEQGLEYTLTASLPDDGFALDAPFVYTFTTPEEMAFDLVAVGDVMLAQLTSEHLQDYDVNYPLAKIADITSSGDLNFANLECPISQRGEPADKKYVFRAQPFTVEVLKQGGFNAVSLANNHVLDYGPQALLDTMALLDQEEIGHVGAGANEEQARQELVLDINGLKVALLAYTRPAPASEYPQWAAGPDKPGTVFHQDRERMLDDVARARDKADILIVSMHWGNEYTHGVTDGQRELGHLLIDNGVDLVLGHHPHAPQGIEIYKDKPIVYSLGNFLFYPFSMEITEETYILRARIGQGGVEEMRLLPVLLGDSQPYVPDDSELERMHTVLAGLLTEFGTDYSLQEEELVLDFSEK